MHLGLPRLKVWRWMLDEFIASLGSQAGGFDLEDWLLAVDRSGVAFPSGDAYWPWLRGAFNAEVARRGLLTAAPVEHPEIAKLKAELAGEVTLATR